MMRRLAEVDLLSGDVGIQTAHRRERLIEAQPDEPPVDWQLVVALRRRASERITEAIAAHQGPLTETDRRLLGRSIVRTVLRDHVDALSTSGEALWPIVVEQAYAQAVENAIFGFGRLQPLFEIADAENIEIHGCDSVVVQFADGRRESRPPVADSDEELVEAVRFLGETVSPARPFDDAHPMLTLALGDRFRLHAIGFGLSYRPSITIRHHTLTDIDLRRLSAGGMMPEEVARFLHAAVLARKSMVISGDQGAGNATSHQANPLPKLDHPKVMRCGERTYWQPGVLLFAAHPTLRTNHEGVHQLVGASKSRTGGSPSRLAAKSTPEPRAFHIFERY